MSFCSPMATRKSIARNSVTGISSGLIQTIEFEEDFIDAIEGVSITLNTPSRVKTWEITSYSGRGCPCGIHGI